jgi:type II secretory pathway component PulF
MASYAYVAKKGPQETVEGVVEAETKEQAVDYINALGYIPIRVFLSSGPRRQSPVFSQILTRPKHLRLRDRIVFLNELSRLIRTGVPILRALAIIREETHHPYLQHIITRIGENIKSGSTLSVALSEFPVVFPPLTIALVNAGEDSGALAVSLQRIADYLKKQEEVVSKIRIALIYPSFMATVGVLTVVFMLVAVVPKIQGIYVGLGQQLPLATTILIQMSTFLRTWWMAIVLLVLFLFFIVNRAISKHREAVAKWQLSLPVYGRFLLKNELVRGFSALSLCIKNGINILRALELTLPVFTNEAIRAEVTQYYQLVKQGQSLGRSFKQSKIFPAFVGNLIILGEESGRMDEMLQEITDFFEHDTEEAIKIFTSQFEPMMILAIGLVLGYIVIAMLLPIFQINLMVN